MKRVTKSDETEIEITQELPTQPRAVSPDGRTLDRWGLPVGGHARARALGDRVDPLVDPTGWDEAPVPAPEPAPVADATPAQD